jgi:hypothetical protein
MDIFERNKSLAFALAALSILHALLLYGLPLPALAVVWLLLCMWLYRAGPAAAMLAAISIACFTLLLNITIGATGLERGIYYRPHEQMTARSADFGETFRPNSRTTLNALFGDIEALEMAGIKEPHEIAYVTDSLGFRNPADYRGQTFVLVGDSFLAGANDTQSCLITEQLREYHGVDTYNLGFPGNMDEYVQRIAAFRKANGKAFKMALFVFEGNDFQPFTNSPVEKMNFLKAYHAFFKETALWRYTRWLYLRAQKKDKNAGHKPHVRRIGKADIAFLKRDLPLASNTSPPNESDLRFVDAFQILKPNLVQIFFVPVKYRVYAKWLAEKPLPNAQLDYLQQAANQAGIPVFDLTPILAREAERMLPGGEYVYWRDDTHWNCNGMRAVAAPIAQQLRLR